jgi:hypothetical protein
VLTLDGLRSVYAEWPAQAVCAACGRHPNAGYAGPATGQIFRAGPDSHYFCEGCAREKAGLTPGELTGHACGPKCTDDLHMELRLEEHAFQLLTPEQQLQHLQKEFGARGWTVRSVEEVHGPPVPGGPPWRIIFVSTRFGTHS